MQFGYILPNYGSKIKASELLEIADVCEEEGFDSVWATDHVIMPTELKEPYGEVLEPLTTLAFIASRTERLRVGTSIIVLPQRNPVLLAKQVAALDVFSKGRMILGVGAGWAEREFGFLNSDFEDRGRVYDESLRLMKALWSEDVVDFEGEFFHIKDGLFFPKPVAKKVPVWIGGNGPISVRRAIRLGDGWHPVGVTVDEFTNGAKLVEESRKDLTLSLRMTVDIRKKRGPTTTQSGERRVAVSGSTAEVRSAVDEYSSVGLTYFCASINHPEAAEIIVDLKKFAAEVVRSYR